jgi:hypothetical protein
MEFGIYGLALAFRGRLGVHHRLVVYWSGMNFGRGYHISNTIVWIYSSGARGRLMCAVGMQHIICELVM